MTNIIFEIPTRTTNWLNPEWAKAEKRRLEAEEIRLIEFQYPELTGKQKAKRLDLTCTQYHYRKQKYGLCPRKQKQN